MDNENTSHLRRGRIVVTEELVQNNHRRHFRIGNSILALTFIDALVAEGRVWCCEGQKDKAVFHYTLEHPKFRKVDWHVETPWYRCEVVQFGEIHELTFIEIEEMS